LNFGGSIELSSTSLIFCLFYHLRIHLRDVTLAKYARGLVLLSITSMPVYEVFEMKLRSIYYPVYSKSTFINSRQLRENKITLLDW